MCAFQSHIRRADRFTRVAGSERLSRRTPSSSPTTLNTIRYSVAYLLSRSVVKLVLPLSLGHWRHSLDTDGPTDRNCRRLPAWALGLSQSPYLATAMQNRLAYRLAEEAFSLVHS